MARTYTMHSPDGQDSLRFIDQGQYGITVELTYSGETSDFGFPPGEVPALIDWLTAYPQEETP